MKKIWLLSFAIALPALAQAADDSGVISLFDGTAAEEVKPKPQDDGESIFSFLNFKNWSKEKPKLSVSEQSKLSSLEQTTILADKGDVNAQLALGYIYLYGDNGVEPDYDKSFEYYAKAAMQNDSVGLNNLGSLYYSGIGIKRNTAKAAVLFEKAAKLGNAEAAVNLGFILITGNGVEKNPSLAMEFFQQAADAKNPTAQFMVGYARYKGDLLDKDYLKAATLIKSAAAANFDEAQYTLALMYINGLGMPQNYGNAVKYLKLAVSQGNVEAMMTLGDVLARGEKYTKDLFTAHVMFNLAAVRGAEGAAAKRDVIESRMKIDEVLSAQEQAERFNPKPSELTLYIRQTFGTNVRSYIDNAN